MNGASKALLGAQLRALLRQRSTLVSLTLTVFAIGASVSLVPLLDLEGRFTEELRGDEDDDESRLPVSDRQCDAELLARTALVGELPGWLEWPAPFVEIDDAELLVRAHDLDHDDRYHLDVMPLGDGAPHRTAEACIRARIRQQRGQSLADLGIAARPETILDLDVAEPVVERRGPAFPEFSGAGLGLLLVLMFTLISGIVATAPTARQSGFLESLLVQRVRRHELLLVWWIEGSLQGTAAVALYLVAAAGIGAVVGQPLAEVPWAAAVAAIVLLPGVFHPFLVDSPSYRSGSLRTILLFYGLIGLVGLAWALEGVAPLLGASTPVGGLGLALLGRTTAAGTLLAIATTALASAAGAWWTVRALQTMDVTGGGLGRTARRRAAGRYGPEVALLMLLALASTTTWVPLDFAANRPLWALLLGQVLFLAVPAVGVARYLGLDTRSVLQWRAPPWWSVALAPVIAAGTVALALAIVTATDPWFPDRSAGAFSDLLRSLMTPAGMLLVVLLPAICEELLFRGAMLGLLRRGMPIWLAIGLQAVLFGAVHLMAERLLPTAAVGIVLGILAWRTRSLLPGMLVHALHNAGALWLAHRGFD